MGKALLKDVGRRAKGPGAPLVFSLRQQGSKWHCPPGTAGYNSPFGYAVLFQRPGQRGRPWESATVALRLRITNLHCAAVARKGPIGFKPVKAEARQPGGFSPFDGRTGGRELRSPKIRTRMLTRPTRFARAGRENFIAKMKRESGAFSPPERVCSCRESCTVETGGRPSGQSVGGLLTRRFHGVAK